MNFRLFRHFRRNVLICAVILTTAFLLKYAYPSAGAKVGQWISGAQENRVTAAVSDLLEELSHGSGITNAVEVFYETIRNTPQD